MDDNRAALITVFDGHTFERYSYADVEKGATYCYYAVDGVQVEQEQWSQRKEEAEQQNMKNLVFHYYRQGTA